MDIKLIMTAWTLHFLALISPGPDFVLALKNTLKHGRFLGFATALGFGIGISIHVTYCITGVALLLKYSPKIIVILKVLGSLYLIWIGIGILRANLNKSPLVISLKDKNFASLVFAGSGMVLLTICWFSIVAWFFSRGKIQQQYLKAEKSINFIFAIFFISSGCFLLFK